MFLKKKFIFHSLTLLIFFQYTGISANPGDEFYCQVIENVSVLAENGRIKKYRLFDFQFKQKLEVIEFGKKGYFGGKIFKIEQQGENVFRNYDSHPSLIFYEGKFIYSSTDLNEAKTIIAHCTVE